jgi:hypothetical protein
MSEEKPAPPINDEANMIANLDLLLNMDVIESENNWSLFSATGDADDTMPDDLPGDEQ